MNDTRTWKSIDQMTDAEIKQSACELDLALQALGQACESMDRADREHFERERRRMNAR